MLNKRKRLIEGEEELLHGNSQRALPTAPRNSINRSAFFQKLQRSFRKPQGHPSKGLMGWEANKGSQHQVHSQGDGSRLTWTQVTERHSGGSSHGPLLPRSFPGASRPSAGVQKTCAGGEPGARGRGGGRVLQNSSTLWEAFLWRSRACVIVPFPPNSSLLVHKRGGGRGKREKCLQRIHDSTLDPTLSIILQLVFSSPGLWDQWAHTLL